MQITRDVREWLRRREGGAALDVEAAAALWGAVLDEAVDDLEIGALLGAQAARGETREELAGLLRATSMRVAPWSAGVEGRCVCIPAYGAHEGEAAWVALAAALLRRFGIPTIVHGMLDSPWSVSPASVLRELGVLPCGSLPQASDALAAGAIAFVPVQLFSPALARLLALRSRLGLENAAHRVAPLVAPLSECVRLVTSDGEGQAQAVHAMASDADLDTLSLVWTAGRAPHPAIRPRIERVAAGTHERLFEADAPDARVTPLPVAAEAGSVARWIERLSHGELPVPVPMLGLVAACLYAVGHAADFNRAKAIAALQAGRLASEDRA